jgi:flagellar basal-body rod protein FlgF
MVTSDGNPVQGEGGAITITPDDGPIQIAKDGTVSSLINGQPNQIGKLKLVDFNNPHALTKEGDSLYSTTQTANDATSSDVKQGMLESSNVKPVVEISHMIEVMRSYEATSSLAKSQEDLQNQAIDKLGQMPN